MTFAERATGPKAFEWGLALALAAAAAALALLCFLARRFNCWVGPIWLQVSLALAAAQLFWLLPAIVLSARRGARQFAWGLAAGWLTAAGLYPVLLGLLMLTGDLT